MLTADGARKTGAAGGPNCRSTARVSGISFASGISFQRKRGVPMSTVNIPSPADQQQTRPAAVSKFSAVLPVSALMREATQRMPLPQAPASEPSLL